MTTFDKVWPPAWDRLSGREQTVAQIDAWLGSPAIAALVRAFGGEPKVTEDPDFSAWLEGFAKRHWDFRKGKERDNAEQVMFEKQLSGLITDAAEALGLADPLPSRSMSYDSILVLGGLIRGCIVRPRYAAELIRGGLHTRTVVGLGAFRSLSDEEDLLAEYLRIPASDEFDAMTQGIQIAFQTYLTSPPTVKGDEDLENMGKSWRVLEWELAPARDAPQRVQVVAAPTSRPDATRANTAETYDFWCRRVKAPSVQTVLVITHPIYVAYQGCLAIQSLGIKYGLDVETVGVSHEAADLGVYTQPFGPQQYLQEIRASIEAMVHLRLALLGSQGR